ncbi:hypothetical protein ACN28E_40700 [Archangium lansingense]|uniref:hypothetical protein n=1 Tax=Archangium lansingense TaxID=2995310 RepID=UPI003B7D957E
MTLPKAEVWKPAAALGVREASRTDHHSYKRLVKDMEALGLRHRRGHDLRGGFGGKRKPRLA